VLALTIFSDGLQSDPDEFRLSMTEYFRAAGRIGLLDLVGAPDYIPRPGRSRIKSTLKYFENIIDGLISTRSRLLENDVACREDLLTLLLRALDPATGQPMTQAEVRSNILTFLSAGHETTANTLSWSLFLLSQCDEWRERVRDEAERELAGPEDGLVDRLVVTKSRDRRSLAAISANRGTEPLRQGTGPAGRPRRQSRITDSCRALRAASASTALASARCL
jgi:cytochrome P450